MKDIKKIDNRQWHVRLSRWGQWMWARFWKSTKTEKDFHEWCKHNNRTTTCHYVRGLLLYSWLMPLIWSAPLIYAFYVFVWAPYQSLGSDTYTNVMVSVGAGVGGIMGVFGIVIAFMFFISFATQVYKLHLRGRFSKAIRGVRKVTPSIRIRYQNTSNEVTTTREATGGGEKISPICLIVQRIKDRHDRICSIIDFEDPRTLEPVNNANISNRE